MEIVLLHDSKLYLDEFVKILLYYKSDLSLFLWRHK